MDCTQAPPPPPPPPVLTEHRAEAQSESAEEVLDPRVLAMLPPQLLQPGEIIILLIKPSPWFILLESLKFLAAVGIGLIAWAMLNRRGMLPIATLEFKDGVLILIGLAGLRLFWEFLEWLSRVYVLTDRRVVRVHGVLRINIFECPLKKIQHTNLLFSMRERAVGLGTIAFNTAGTSFTEAHWRMIAEPLEVHRIVVQTIQRDR